MEKQTTDGPTNTVIIVHTYGSCNCSSYSMKFSLAVGSLNGQYSSMVYMKLIDRSISTFLLELMFHC